MNLSTREDVPGQHPQDGGQVQAAIEHIPGDRPPLPLPPPHSSQQPQSPGDQDIIETVASEEDDITRSHSGGSSHRYDNFPGTPASINEASILQKMDEFSPEIRQAMLQKLQDQQLQERFPTATIVSEKDKVTTAIEMLTEKQDMLEHALETLQVSRDDVDRSSRLMQKKAGMGEREVELSRELADVKNLNLKLRRTNVQLNKVASGAVSEEEEIEDTLTTSRQLTGRASTPLGIRQESSDSDDDFTEASDTLGEQPPEVPVPPVRNKKKTKTKSKEKSKDKSVKFVAQSSTAGNNEPNTPATGSDDNVSVFSNSNSIFGATGQAAIYIKLKKALEDAEDTLKNDSRSLIALKDSKSTCHEALKYMADKAPSLKQFTVQESEECEDLEASVRLVMKRLNRRIEAAEERKEDRKLAPRVQIPEFYCHPSAFLQWRKEFRDATKNLTDIQRTAAAKKAVRSKDEAERKELNQMFSNCESYKAFDKMMISKFGDLEVLVPLFQNKLMSLKKHPTSIEDEQRALLTILEFIRMLKAHGQDERFDNTLYRSAFHKLRSQRRDHLDLFPVKKIVIPPKPKPKTVFDFSDDEEDELLGPSKNTRVDLEDFIVRLESYQQKNFVEINEAKIANPQQRVSKEEEKKKPRRDNYNFAIETRKPTCKVCGKDHLSKNCPTLQNPKMSVESKKKILDKNSLCHLCVEPQGPNHNKSRCHMGMNKKGHFQSYLCKKCDSQLNYYICCFVKRFADPSHSTDAPKIHTTSVAATKIDVGENELEDEELMVNGCPPGACVGDAEVFTVTDPSGKEHELLGIHDPWSKSSLYDTSVLDLMTDKKKAIYNLSTVSSVKTIQGGKGSLKVHTENGQCDIEGLVVPLGDKFVEPVSVRVPKHWRQAYNLPEKIQTCSGKISVIFGLDAMKKNISPEVLAQDNGVRLSRSRLTGKAMLSGYNEELMTASNKKSIESFFVSTTRAEAADAHSLDKEFLALLNPSSFNTTKLSICDSCRLKPKCVDCKFSLTTRNAKERHEEKLLSDSCSYIPEKKRWVADPPLKKQVTDLPTYKEETLKDMRRLQNKLRKDKDGQKIAAELDKCVFSNIKDGKYILEEDLIKTNPEFSSLQESFSTYNFVYKDSESTAVRMTHNFSFSRGGNISYNSLQFTGSSLNNKLYYLVLKNSGFRYSLNLDIRKYYNQISVSQRIAALQKFHYPRDGILTDSEVVTVVALCLVFGSVFAQCVAQICKNRTSEMFIKDKDKVADEIVKDSYTDDATCQSNDSMAECWRLAKIVIGGLEMGGFSFKDAVPSHVSDPDNGDQDWSVTPCPPGSSPGHTNALWANQHGTDSPNLSSQSDVATVSHLTPDPVCSSPPGPALQTPPAPQQPAVCRPQPQSKTTENVPMPGCSQSFGLWWYPGEGGDIMKLKISINLSKKRRGRKCLDTEITTKKQFEDYVSEHGLTKRICLSLCHQLFDILNHFYTVKLQLSYLYRELITRQTGLHYDGKIDPLLHQDWADVIDLMLQLKEVEIPRCAIPKPWRPGNYISLITFCDGSGLSSICKIYCRVAIDDKMTEFTANFVTASFKLGENNANHAVKQEFHSLTLAIRLLEMVTSCWKHIDISEIILLSDSQVVLGALFSYTARLKLMYAEKVAEALEVIKRLNVETLYVPSKDNLADDGSRKELIRNYPLESRYWHGTWLSQPKHLWPTKQYTFKDSDIEDITSKKLSEITSFAVTINEHFLSQLLAKSFSFDKICRIICYVKIAARKLFKKFYKKKNLPDLSVADLIEDVKMELYSLASPTLEQCKGLQRQYDIVEDKDQNRILMITRSFAQDQQIVQQKRILIDGESIVGRKLIKKYHQHMSSTEYEMADITNNGLFILKARRYLDKESQSCVICKKLRQESLNARIGPSYQSLASSYPIGQFLMIDLLGPLKCSLGRKTLKVWLFVAVCLWSKVYQVLPLFKIDSDAILTALKSVAYLNNGVICKFVCMDWGKQLTALQSLDDQEKAKIKMETENLSQVLDQTGIKVVLSSPWAPHRQSLCERGNRELKRTLKRANIFNHSYKFHQIYHLCHFLTYNINSRPLNIRYANNSLLVLNANKLLRGECQGFANHSSLQINLDGNKRYKRLNELENQLNVWFSIWKNSYLENSKKITTWKEPSSQQLKLGSIVLIRDHTSKETGYFSFGEIIEVVSPRTFRVEYVKFPPKTNKNGQILKPAVLDVLTRPITSLIYLCEKENDKIISLDPYSDSDQLSDQEATLASSVIENMTPARDAPSVNIENVTQDQLISDKSHDPRPIKGMSNSIFNFASDKEIEKIVDLTATKK